MPDVFTREEALMLLRARFALRQAEGRLGDALGDNPSASASDGRDVGRALEAIEHAEEAIFDAGNVAGCYCSCIEADELVACIIAATDSEDFDGAVAAAQVKANRRHAKRGDVLEEALRPDEPIASRRADAAFPMTYAVCLRCGYLHEVSAPLYGCHSCDERPVLLAYYHDRHEANKTVALIASDAP